VNIEQPKKIRAAIILICKPPAMSVDSFLSSIVGMMVSMIESVRFATFEEGRFQCRFVRIVRMRTHIS